MSREFNHFYFVIVHIKYEKEFSGYMCTFPHPPDSIPKFIVFVACDIFGNSRYINDDKHNTNEH